MNERSRTTLYLGSIAAILYFSEGLPFGIVKEFVPLYLRVQKVDLTSIGLLNIVGFAWTLKFLWSPFVDTVGTYKRWIAGAVLGIAFALGGMALRTAPGPVFYGFVALLALASATQDIAVDAFTIRMTPTKLLGPINSIRVTAYRIALTSPGVLAVIGQHQGWPHAFAFAAVVAVIVLLITLLMEPRLQPGSAGPAEAGTSSNFIGAFKHWLLRPRAGVLLAIAFTYRIGEFAIVSMIKPYWVDRGYTPAEIGTITSIVGVVVSILGAIAGGALLPRLGLYRGLLWLGLGQSASNIGYALVATISAGRWAIYTAAVVENVGYGLGTAAFLAFLMSICDRERAATEYALLSAAYGLTGTIVASASGWLAQTVGYAPYFWVTVVLGLPSLLLIPMVRKQIEAQEAEH
ncbi:MAG TPA: MFS transporter [Thermoanaerobaculia bacterium]|nr:MFS transporter [Thermoanaerobaculia bacterium]